MEQKIIVLSGVNLYLGGTLKIMQDCIESLVTYSQGKYRIIALVHDENLFQKYKEVEYISLPLSRKSWFFRLYYEYLFFNKISKKYQPYCWLSLHDSSPSVSATVRAVYYHHPVPFYKGKVGWREFRMERSFFLFHHFYRYFYKINLKKNNYVIVQQDWIRDEMSRDFNEQQIIIAPPSFETLNPILQVKKEKRDENGICFFYPSIPRVYKNFEVIADAARILQNKGIGNFCIFLTTNGNENNYSKWLHETYSAVSSLRFIGLLTREQMNEFYEKCDCVIFPSKLETWGLPVSEAKGFGKPILIADLPYAKETIGLYDKAKFFDPSCPDKLANAMEDFISGNLLYDATKRMEYEAPYAADWEQVFDILLTNKK